MLRLEVRICSVGNIFLCVGGYGKILGGGKIHFLGENFLGGVSYLELSEHKIDLFYGTTFHSIFAVANDNGFTFAYMSEILLGVVNNRVISG
jgi:hypothetical protein